MSESEPAALESRLRSIDAKPDRIEIGTAPFAAASVRHSKRLKALAACPGTKREIRERFPDGEEPGGNGAA